MAHDDPRALAAGLVWSLMRFSGPRPSRRPVAEASGEGETVDQDNYLRARTRAISLSMSEDSVGFGALTFSSPLLIM